MRLIDRLVEYFLEINRKMKRWQRLVSVIAAIAVFMTTYALILPAITLDADTASTKPGIEVTGENEADIAGTVFESTQEEEPESESAVEEEPEAEPSVEEEPEAEPEEELETEPEKEEEPETEPEEEARDEEAAEASEPGSSENEDVQSGSDRDDSASDNEAEVEGAPSKEEAAPAAKTAKTVITEDTPLITEKTRLIYKANEYTVYADFDGSAKLPVNVELKVKEITKESDPEAYEMYYKNALAEIQDKYDENTGLSFAKFYDITFVYDKQEMEPQGPVSIKIEYKKAVEIEEETKIDTVHFDKEDEEKVEVIENTEKEVKDNTKVKSVEFESDKFSVYGIVGAETFTAQYFTEDGETYNISVTASAEAHIPSDAHLEISEVKSGSEKYDELFAKAEAAVTDGKDASVPYARFFDIAIVKDGEKIQPDAPVDVKITFDETVEADRNAVFNAVHITENEIQVIDVTTEGDETDDAVTVDAVEFSAEGFSYYGVTYYTVDFAYGEYTYNLDGNHEIRLSELLQILNIDAETADVTNVTVELVEQVDETVEENEFYVERAGEDWLLKSDVAFGNIYSLIIEQRDGSKYVVEVRDAGSVDLTDLCRGPGGSITVTCDESVQHTEVSRDANITFTMNYHIRGPREIGEARNADEWVYDMSSMIGTDANSPLAGLSEGTAGAIVDNFGNVVGEYTIANGKITLKITEDSFWVDPETGAQKHEVDGFVSFNAQLNENHNYNKTTETITFPGNADVPLIYETKTLQSSKGVGTSEGQYSQTTDSSVVQMVENADGTYTLYYEVSATPNINFKTLSISDTLSGGQTLVPSSVQLSVNGGGWQNVTVNSTGTGFTFDVAANQGGSVEGGKTYKIRYQTTLTKQQVESQTVQTNQANWTWDVGTNEDNTSVKPKFDKNVELGKAAGVVEGTYNLGNWADANVVQNPDGSATIYYDVRISPNTRELSSLTVSDDMMGSGSVKVYKGSESLGSATAANGTVDLLAFLNTHGGIEPGAEYHLRYSTTIQPKEDGTFDNVHNKAHLEFDSTPKEVEITVKPKVDKTVTSTKKVQGNGGEQTSGNITVQKNDNEDFYRLHYKLTVKPGTETNTLAVTDSISGGQEYISGTFKLGFNDANGAWKSFDITPNVNGNSFNFNLAAFLRSQGYNVTAQTEYQITYDTKITEDQLGTSQTNTSNWTWDHDSPGPDTTDVTPGVPEKGYKIDKTAMHGDVDVNTDQHDKYVEPGDIVDFTVVVGLDEDGDPKNMAGHRIYDEISNYGTLVGDVTISPAVDGRTTLDGSELDGTADGTTKKVYDYTFPAEGDYTQPNGYTITYHIKISENSALSGWKTLNNRAYIDNTHKETRTPVYYGVPATTKKSFSEWNENDKKIYWYIDVEIPEGKSLHNLYVTDYHMQYGTNGNDTGWIENAANLSFDSSDIDVSWLDESITDPAPAYTLKNDSATPNEGTTVNTQGIFFTELTHSIRIRVATVSPVEFDSLTAYYAYNKAYVHSDEGEIGRPGALTDKYTATEYRFKKTGEYDQENNVATWTVEINKNFLEVNPDFEPYFTDTIPDNMEFIGDTIHVDGYIGNIYTNQGNIDMPVTVRGNVIQPVNVGNLHPEWGEGGKYKLSKNYFRITYQTKIKDSYLQQILGADVLTEQKFTNFAELQDQGGDTKKTDDDTVEYKYDNLIDKQSGNLILNEYIPYTITINPEGKVINDNEPYTVSDVISTDVNLYIGRLSGTTYPYVRDTDGNDMLESGEVSISYNDDTRELAITVPDGEKVTFVFLANAIENGTHIFTNSVVLNAKISDEDSTEREYVIKKSEAGIQGVDLYVSLKKIDRNNPLKGLSGAKFKLVHVATPGIPRNDDGKPQTVTTYVDDNGETQYVAGGDGTFGDEEEVGIYTTVGESGGINFTDIEPYEVYYWVETEPAPGYIMTNTEKHYFVAYPIVRNNTEATTENQHNVWAIDNTATAANGVTIVSARSGYSWNVTNLAEEKVTGHFEGVKTLQGRDMDEDEFTFSVEAVSANVTKIINDTEEQVDLTPEEMPMPEETTVKNPAGTENTEVGFAFGDINFTMPGTYIYKIKEEAGNDTIDYDSTEYYANVTVERDSESGKLTDPVITYTKADGSEVTKPAFVNKVQQGSLKILKEISNGNASDKVFTFEVVFTNTDQTPYEGEVTVVDRTRTEATTVTTGSDGKLTVSVTGTGTATISELPVGITYVVTEPARDPADGWEQDGEVSYSDSAKTIAANEEDTATVKNKYVATGKTAFDGTKTIENRKFKDGDSLSVAISSTDGGKLPDPATKAVELTAGQNTVDFSFAEVEYTLDDLGGETSKTFHYEVTETATMEGTTPDSRTHTIEVTVTDNGDGTLDIVKAYKADEETETKTSFVNTFDTSINAQVKGIKEITGSDDYSGYTFTLTGVNVPDNTTATSDEQGQFEFDAISYTMAEVKADNTAVNGVYTKVYSYKVTENLPNGQTATEEEKAAGFKVVDGKKYDLSEKDVTITVTYNENTGEMTATQAPNQTLVKFTNEQLGKLKLTKTLAETDPAGETDKNFTFTITFSGEKVSELNSSYTATKTDADGNETEVIVSLTQSDDTKTASVLLKADESIEINDLPIGVTYTVTEQDDPAYKVSSKVNDENQTVSMDGVETTFTNERVLGKVDVTKTVQLNGEPDSEAEGKSFWVAIYSDQGTTRVPNQEAKQITIGADGTGTAEFDNLPVGTYYVYELTAEDGTPVTGNTATIESVAYLVTTDNSGAVVTKKADGSAQDGSASITNNKTEKGTLVVNKSILYNDAPDAEASGKTITVGLYKDDAATQPVQHTVNDQEVNWTETITIGDAGTGTATFSELDYGQYYVFELDDEGNPVTGDAGTINGIAYSVSAADNGPTLSHTNQSATVEITNSQTEEGSLEVTKEVQINGTKDATFNGTFEVGLFKVTTEEGADGPVVTETKVGDNKTITVTNGETTTAAKFEGLEIGATYRVYEMKGDDKIAADAQYNEYTVSYTNQEVQVTRSNKDVTGSVVTNNKETTTVKIDKEWFQAGDVNKENPLTGIQNASVTVKLTDGTNDVTADASGNAISEQTLTGAEEPKWTYEWTNLPKYNSEGQEIRYQVVETSAKVETDQGDGEELLTEDVTAQAKDDTKPNELTLENTLPTVEIEGTKTWVLNDGTVVSTDPTLTLKRMSAKEGSVEEPVSDVTPTWTESDQEGIKTYKYSDLPKYDAEGYKYTYTVTEAAFTVGDTTYIVEKTDDGYVVKIGDEIVNDFTVEQDGNDIVNTEQKEFEFTKIWKDGEDNNVTWPEGKTITITLYSGTDTVVGTGEFTADGGTTGDYAWTATLNADNTYTFKTKGLPKYDNAGNEISYYVQETKVDEYKDPEYATKAADDVSSGTAQYTTEDENQNKYDKAENGYYIINRPEISVVLPNTGGSGTRLFYGMGIVFVAMAGFFLFIKKRSIRDLSEGRW